MSTMIFIVSRPMPRSSLFVQQSPSAPYWRSCAGEEMKSAMIDVSYAASLTQIVKPIHSKAIVSRLDLYLTVLCLMASYAAADCHFRQDAHRRTASVLARIRCAKERERGKRARHHQTNYFFFFREMTAFFRGPTTIFRRLENSNNFQRNVNFFQNLSMDCSGAIHLILGTFLLPIFRYPLPRPKMDFLIPAARSRSSRGPAKSAHFFSKQAKKFRTHTTFFRLLTQNFRT